MNNDTPLGYIRTLSFIALGALAWPVNRADRWWKARTKR